MFGVTFGGEGLMMCICKRAQLADLRSISSSDTEQRGARATSYSTHGACSGVRASLVE